ncbi:hypothetical protein TIFTF001_026625 [Ficus carica]|uniref:Mitochondrial import receptor subunit TOM20 n=1 Tax=Ficus carica TaxID=3494 RepID=A0AA88IYD0_FICCA|nr:hypothetical protein TIFTF001_026625 [Ficus carica]
MDLQQSDFDRLLFFEHARKTAEATYAKNPLDSDNLTRWAGALLELSQFQTVPESKKMVLEAISRLEEALLVDTKRPDTLWCLGNAHTSHAFLTPDMDEAREYFSSAAKCFQQALDEEPDNELYRKSLEVAHKDLLEGEGYRFIRAIFLFLSVENSCGYGNGVLNMKVALKYEISEVGCISTFGAPELHKEIHKHGFSQQAMGSSGPSSSSGSGAKTAKKKRSSDLKYDIFGWIILAVGIVAWVGFAKSHVPPPPPR